MGEHLMSQHQRTRAARYKRLFQDNLATAALLRADIWGSHNRVKDDHLLRQHRLAREGKASYVYLNKVEIFFGLTVGEEGNERGNGYLRP